MYPRDPIQAVLFDLDGTLLDTGNDIANATNRVLVHHGQPPLPYQQIRPHIGGGVTAVIKKFFPKQLQQDKLSLIRQQILQSYQQLMLQETTLFAGMSEVLNLIEDHQLPWGIITSKPAWLAEPLVARIEALLSNQILIGRETLPFIKPHPLPLTYAAQQLKHIAPQHCVYIGDAASDMVAAKAAGMHSIAAAYGFILPPDNPKKWQADYIIDTPYDLIAWLNSRIEKRT